MYLWKQLRAVLSIQLLYMCNVVSGSTTVTTHPQREGAAIAEYASTAYDSWWQH